MRKRFSQPKTLRNTPSIYSKHNSNKKVVKLFSKYPADKCNMTCGLNSFCHNLSRQQSHLQQECPKLPIFRKKISEPPPLYRLHSQDQQKITDTANLNSISLTRKVIDLQGQLDRKNKQSEQLIAKLINLQGQLDRKNKQSEQLLANNNHLQNQLARTNKQLQQLLAKEGAFKEQIAKFQQNYKQILKLLKSQSITKSSTKRNLENDINQSNINICLKQSQKQIDSQIMNQSQTLPIKVCHETNFYYKKELLDTNQRNRIQQMLSSYHSITHLNQNSPIYLRKNVDQSKVQINI